jgi:hypothetical protein
MHGKTYPYSPQDSDAGPCAIHWEAKQQPVEREGKCCGNCSSYVDGLCTNKEKIAGRLSLKEPFRMPAHGGHRCDNYASKVAQRWVDEYKAETGISIPAEALQADMEGKFKTVSFTESASLGEIRGIVTGSKTPFEVMLDYHGEIGSIPKSEHSVMKFHDAGPRGVMSKEVFEAMNAWIRNGPGSADRDSLAFAQKVVGIANPRAVVKIDLNNSSKETSNMDAIIRLADSQLNKELEEFGALPIDIRTALVDLQAKAKKEAAEGAAAEVMKLLGVAGKVVESKVASVRAYRKIVEATKEELAVIGRAKAYGLETSNFIPLAILTGQISVSSVENKDLTAVPEDWAPTGTKSPVAPAPEDKSA